MQDKLTSIQLDKIFEVWIKAIHEGYDIDGLSTDFQQQKNGYTLEPNSGKMRIMESYGIGLETIGWMKGCLINRRQ